MSPDIECLKELWQQQEWSKLLRGAKSLLMRGGWTVEELAYLNYFACRGRFGETEVYSGLPSGELARRLAEDVGAWDLLGNIYITLSAGYHWIMQYERSLEYAFAFLEKLPRFSETRDREGEAWIRVGMGYEGLGRRREAFLAYERAHRILKRIGRWHWAYSAVRLATRIMYEEDPEVIPQMLAEQMRLRRLDRSNRVVSAMLYLERSRYALHVGDYSRCLRLAQLGRRWAADALQTFESHLQMANCYRAMGDWESAMRNAHLARAAALESKMFAQEYAAVELVYALMKEQGPVTADWLPSSDLPMDGITVSLDPQSGSEVAN